MESMEGRVNVTSLDFYVYARPFTHRIYFINARKMYVSTYVKIAQQWKSTLNKMKAMYQRSRVNVKVEPR